MANFLESILDSLTLLLGVRLDELEDNELVRELCELELAAESGGVLGSGGAKASLSPLAPSALMDNSEPSWLLPSSLLLYVGSEEGR